MKLILFDGVCNLCNGFVQFIIKEDKKKIFSFGSLQSDQALQILENQNILNTKELDSVILIDDGVFYVESEAALRILHELPRFRWLTFLRLIPTPLRDWIYRLIAKNRYKVFGRRDECMMPDPQLKDRFIS